MLAKHRRGELAPVTTVTVAELVAGYLVHLEALVAAGERGERTVERYRSHLEGHVVPALGRVQVRKLTADHLALLVRTCREKGLAPWTIKGNAHTPLGRVLALAQRRGIIVENPRRRLQPEELPKGVEDPPRVLSREEIAALLAGAPDRYRPIIGVAVFAGLRQRASNESGRSPIPRCPRRGQIHTRPTLTTSLPRVPREKKLWRSRVSFPLGTRRQSHGRAREEAEDRW